MIKDEPRQDAEHQKSVSDYAPRRAGEPYLTEAMIAQTGNGAEPVRLTQMAAPALDQIGKLTADKIELSALAFVENARQGADTLLAEAQAQAADMIHMAETQAADMREFAKAIRRYTDRKAAQVGEFCSVAESIVATMHGLGANFQTILTSEAAAEKEEQERPIQLPAFLSRAKANLGK